MSALPSRLRSEQSRCPGCQDVSDDPMCARCRDAEDALRQSGLLIGAAVRIQGERGTDYVIRGYGRDGSLSLYGGNGQRRGSRSVMPSRLILVVKA